MGDLRFEQGKAATEHADDYVFVTVFFAIVLFFAGISLRFAWLPMRLLILGLGTVILLYGGSASAACRRTDACVRSREPEQRVDDDQHAEDGHGVEGQRSLVRREPVLDVEHPLFGAGTEHDRQHDRHGHECGRDHDVDDRQANASGVPMSPAEMVAAAST